MNLRRLTALAIVGALLAACSSSSPAASEAAGNGTIDATVHEWSIDLASNTASAGEVTFNISNTGDETHEFVIVSTDLDAAELPVVDDQVDESAFTPVDEVEDIESGTNPTLTVDLDPGHYVILCNLLAHYGKGMHANLTVE
jgi:uncharacterized cupredoxin-like copper-binding protein